MVWNYCRPSRRAAAAAVSFVESRSESLFFGVERPLFGSRPCIGEKGCIGVAAARAVPRLSAAGSATPAAAIRTSLGRPPVRRRRPHCSIVRCSLNRPRFKGLF